MKDEHCSEEGLFLGRNFGKMDAFSSDDILADRL
jgi:hypothetical protein